MQLGATWVLGLLAAGAVGVPAAQASVVLNEVNCEGTDWVELVNTGDATADLTGWLLTDDPLSSSRADHRLRLAPGTTIPGQGTLVVEKSASGFPFGVKCGEDTIRLADAADAQVDEVTVPELEASADTWGRYPDGTGPWRETVASRGAPNTPAETGGAPPDDAAGWLFDPGRVVEIDLGLSEEARDELGEEPDEYVDGTFSLTTTGGTYGPYAVGVRLKGNASFRPLTGKAAFKVSFNHAAPGGRFLGLRRLTLNNMVQDPSMLHEVLAYDLFRAADVPAPRAGFAFVRVNGEPYGLYLDVETLDEVSLPRWFPSTAHLYEGGALVDVRDGKLGAFETDVGDPDDRGDLEALTEAAGAKAFSASLSARADLDELTRMWAVERYIGDWDGYSGIAGPNNYYLHSDDAGRFSMLPWGTDNSWSLHTSFDLHGSGRLFGSCMREWACRTRYRDALQRVRELAGSLDLGTRASAHAAQLAPWQLLDPRREQSLEQIAAGVAGVQAFVAERPGELDAWLGQEPAPPATPPPPPSLPGAAVAAPGPAMPANVVESAAPEPPRVARAAVLAVGAPRAGRTGLLTEVRVPGAGVLTQQATARAGRRPLARCRARAAASRAGTVVLRCPLSALPPRGTFQVTVVTRFAPASGVPQTVTRRLGLRRPAAARQAG